MEQESQRRASRLTNAYPLVLTNLAQVRCVVVGGGSVAERKVADLLAGGAQPWVISPELTAQLAAWSEGEQLRHCARPYQPGDLAGAFLVIAATNDPLIQNQIAHEAASRGCLLNMVDQPERGNMHTVGTVRRGDLLLSVSTGGSNPALARHIRHQLARRYGPEYAALTAALRAMRPWINVRLNAAQRSGFFAALLESDWQQWRESDLQQRIAEIVHAFARSE